MLKEKLTPQQQKEILQTLFGFDLVNTNDDHWVVLDEEGDEFYAFDKNLKFDLTTLAGIIEYSNHAQREKGFADCQYQIQKVLGIN